MVDSENAAISKQKRVMALRGHPRSLIFAEIESEYRTIYSTSAITLVVFCPVSEILHWFLLK